MPWYFPWTDSIKKRASSYLLHHYLGGFLKQKLSLDQLSIDLYNGTGTIHDVSVDDQAINAQLENAGLPFELVDGFASSVQVSIPWSSLITDDTAVEIHNLQLTIRPKQRTDAGDFAVSWMSQSMTSSLQLAEECLKDDASSRTLPEGLEAFAQTIESVVSRIRITLVDTAIRLEHCPDDSPTGIALELLIGRIEYFDEASKPRDSSVDDPSVKPQPSTFSIKNVHIKDGITLHTDIYSPCQRPSATDPCRSTVDSFVSTSSIHPVVRQPSYISSCGTDSLPQEQATFNSFPIKFLMATGQQRVKVKIRNDEKIPGPKFVVDVQLGCIGAMISPKQVHLLNELVTAFTDAAAQATETPMYDHSVAPGRNKPMGREDFGQVEALLQNHMFSSPPYQPIVDEHINLDNLDGTQIDHSLDSGLFYSVGGHNSGMSDLMTSSMYSGSTIASTLTKTTMDFESHAPTERSRQPTHRTQRKGVFDETQSQQSVVKMNVAFFICALLNENPVTSPKTKLDAGETDAEKMKNISTRFFDGFTSQRTHGDLLNIRSDMAEYILHSHIKVIVKKLELEAKQKMQTHNKRKHSDLAAELSIGHCEVTEWLAQTENIRTFAPIMTEPTSELLTFSYGEPEHAGLPCIKLSIYSDSKTRKGTVTDQCSTKSNIVLKLCRPLTSEVDISITDRLHDLLNSRPLLSTPRRPQHYTHNETSSSKDVTNFSIRSESDATIFLRFPIADLRKDPAQRLAWWRRNLRQEKLELLLSKLSFNTETGADSRKSEIVFECRSIQAFFHPGAGEERVAFANIGQELSDHEKLECPRFDCKGANLNHSYSSPV